ncbi:MAG: hypothetical protein ACLQVF_04440 [Isosphaeraceae bacterium]
MMDRGLARVTRHSVGYLDIQTHHRSALPESVSGALRSTVLVSPDAAPGGCAVGSILDDFGQMGAATGLAAVAKAAVCLEQEMIPCSRGSSEWLRSLTEPVPSLFVPGGRQFWLRNRGDGPRRAAVRVCGLGGALGEVVLEEFEPSTAADGSSVQGSKASGARAGGLFMVEAGDQASLSARIEELTRFACEASCQDVDALARRWWQRCPGDRQLPLAIAIVADGIETLKHLLEAAAVKIGDHRLEGDGRRGSIHAARAGSARAGPPSIAFVYPGLGCHFAGMGRELSAMWPDVLRRLDAESGTLRDQLEPALWWGRELPPVFPDHRAPIVGSVWVGSLVTEILRGFGVYPRAAIGYSMGESTALVALRAWTDRDLLLSRIRTSPLFEIDLAGPCEAARRHWELGPTEPVDWVAGVVSCSAESVEAVVSPGRRVYVLVRNSADETVIGGQREAVDEVVEALRSGFVVLPHVSTVHCEIGRIVEAGYRALHDLETSTPEGIDFYSGVSGQAYPVDRRSAADAITAQATQRIDFPAVIERAYQDGVRVFLEVGPGGSCTRHIDRILGDRPHRALSACPTDREPFGAILEVLGALLAERVPVDLAGLYGSKGNLADIESATTHSAGEPVRRTVRVDVRGRGFSVPQPSRVDNTISYDTQTAADFVPHPPLSKGGPGGVAPAQPTTGPGEVSDRGPSVTGPRTAERPRPLPGRPVPHVDTPSQREGQTDPENVGSSTRFLEGTSWSHHFHQAERATAEAHRAFLRTSQQTADLMARLISLQFSLLQSPTAQATKLISSVENPSVPAICDPRAESVGPGPATPHQCQFVFGREQCLEFAVRSIASVLGPDYAPIDVFPTRVRLPDLPLMLVDRILAIEGRPRSLEEGRIVTEHVVRRDAWYLDGGKVPPCIAIEAGQADLFLCAYLGADFVTEGRAVYRLLDATVTFHRGLPGPGDVIRYDIRINRFFRQGNTLLFRFQFDATVDGEPLLTMRDGCAGFFSAEELAAGKGIVTNERDPRAGLGPSAEIMADLVPMTPGHLDERQLDALRTGDAAAGLGSPLARLAAIDPPRLPAGRMALLHRVALLDPKGGPHGLGLIRAEADIRPSDWFLVCHFVDDRVMPGTLMYECCLHALRILLMRIGFVGPRDQTAFEPVIGIANRLRCRGQVVESTRVVTYEVAIKERGYRPEPYAVADALIFADGKPIVEVREMALQLSGTDRQGLEQLWAIRSADGCPAAGAETIDVRHRPVLFDQDRIVEFAVGKPSAAFGDRYRPFDEERFIARLPAPPFQFIHRIMRIDAEPWVMAAGSAATAEYDIPPDAWYFDADRQESIPHAVLLEAALQASGWLAAYMGSALNSDDDLKFRILGGSARKHRVVTRRTGTLAISVKATKVSQSAGMILQQYEFAILSREGVVYDGVADLGFFHPRSLAQPDGMRDRAPDPAIPEEEAAVRSVAFPTGDPFPDSRWRMVDEIHDLRLEGGPHGLGALGGSARIDPDSWLFRAHFLGDPVWPGSLGQESLLQLLKVMAAARWGASASCQFESPGLAMAHHWTYRGQITPENRLMTIRAEIKQCDDRRRWLVADGYFGVDGRVIHQMNDFSLRLCDS